MAAQYINIPHDEDEEDPQVVHSPFSSVSETVSTPPLSPCTPFLSPDSIDSHYGLPGSPEFRSPFLLDLPLSLSGRQTVSPHEIFSPLPYVEELSIAVVEPEAPPAPVVPTQPLPLLDTYSDPTPPTSPVPPPFRPSPPPVPGPSTLKRSVLKRQRWSDNEGDESDEFTPERRKVARPSKRMKSGSQRAGARPEGKGAKCDLCGKRLGRATDIPRHKASCDSNPERATRETPCKICGKLLPGTL